jgi:hypothetical protein
MILFALAILVAVTGTVLAILKDGYRRVPTRRR